MRTVNFTHKSPRRPTITLARFRLSEQPTDTAPHAVVVWGRG